MCLSQAGWDMLSWWWQRHQRSSRNTQSLLRSGHWTNTCHLSKADPGWAQNQSGGHYMTKGLNRVRMKNERHDDNPCSQKKNKAGDFCHGLLSPVLQRYKLQFSLFETKTCSLISRQWAQVHDAIWLGRYPAVQKGRVSLKNMEKLFVLLSCGLPSVFLCMDFILSFLPVTQPIRSISHILVFRSLIQYVVSPSWPNSWINMQDKWIYNQRIVLKERKLCWDPRRITPKSSWEHQYRTS